MSAKVLVIDDSGFVRQHVKRVLSEAGFEVIDAGDGNEGLAAVVANPDLAMVICDVNMPKRSGLEFLEVMAADKTRNLPIVMLTTEGQHELILRAKELGAKGWIVKPFKPDMLVLTVRKLTGTAAAA